MGSSNEEDDGDYKGVDKDHDKNASQELLSPNIAQTIHILSSKKKTVIELENEDLTKSEDSTDMSAFKARPFEKAKVVAKKKK
eukprot:909352-Ditylum_brightwellii.AAC.1